MTTREVIKIKIDALSDADLAALVGFLEDRERFKLADAETQARRVLADEQLALLRDSAADWSAEESFSFQMGVKGFHVRNADADANLREAKVFATMLDTLPVEEKINALLNARGHRDDYVMAASRMVKTMVEPMTWAQERAFDIGLVACIWSKHDPLERHEIASFTFALIEKIQVARQELHERIEERNARLTKENPNP
ncbi:hypothetical protein DESA109040_16595 [Deinococcus saxicola]|uniref:hypothetical protein n=1 Tax=Deinococcus saxicola TaxID=249406 RepID=UPI0039EE8FA9